MQVNQTLRQNQGQSDKTSLVVEEAPFAAGLAADLTPFLFVELSTYCTKGIDIISPQLESWLSIRLGYQVCVCV